MYVSGYSPIQSAFGGIGMQGWQSGQTAFPMQQTFSAPIHQSFAQSIPFQQGISPWQFAGYSGFPHNVVSYSFNPAWQQSGFASGSHIPAWGWNQANAFASGNISGSLSPAVSGGYRIESTGMVQPRVELAETNTDLVVTAELPNINANDLNLTVTDDSLSISAMAYAGNSVMPVHRTVCLPTSIRSEQVNASFSNGFLEARLPKSDANVRRRIRVNPSA